MNNNKGKGKKDTGKGNFKGKSERGKSGDCGILIGASSSRESVVVVVCASCPVKHHDEALRICNHCNIQKAFGKAGDMVDKLSGKDWISKWEAKVVMTVVTSVNILRADRAHIFCIEGGPHCDLEASAQPKLVRAIRQELRKSEFPVQVVWLSFEDFKDFSRSRPHVVGDTSPSSSSFPTQQQASRRGGGGGVVTVVREVAADNVKKNRKEQQGADEIEWACVRCPRTFRTKEAAWAHMESTGHTFWTCSCGKEFNSRGGLQQHAQSLGHSIDLSDSDIDDGSSAFWTCSCGKEFSSEKGLLQHSQSLGHPPIDLISDSSDGSVECWTCSCGKEFNSEKSLLQHAQSLGHPIDFVSDSDGSVECWICSCGKEFSSESGLQQHARSLRHTV